MLQERTRGYTQVGRVGSFRALLYLIGTQPFIRYPNGAEPG
jgi:hypothetical protein